MPLLYAQRSTDESEGSFVQNPSNVHLFDDIHIWGHYVLFIAKAILFVNLLYVKLLPLLSLLKWLSGFLNSKCVIHLIKADR